MLWAPEGALSIVRVNCVVVGVIWMLESVAWSFAPFVGPGGAPIDS